MMTRTLIIVAAQLVLVAAFVLYSRHRVRKHLRALPRRPVRARIPAGHPDAGFVLSDGDRHRLAEVGMDSMVDVPEPTYQTTGEA